MTSGTLGVFMVMALVCGTLFATGERGSDAGIGAQRTILEISPMSVTVDAGKDVQMSYAITGATTATLSGLPVRPEDLRAGMVATFVLTPDNKTVVTMHAEPAPRTTKKPKPPTDTTVWIMH